MPADLEWPRCLKEEVETHGADAVWQAGMKALGYPPSWVATTKEVSAILTELEK